MLFHLLATFMIGVLAASVAFVLMRLTKGWLPRYVIPIAAGASMIAYNIWNEYTWFQRTSAALPPSFVVAEVAPPSSTPFSPWTYVFGRIQSFKVLDKRSVRTNPKRPGFAIVELYRFERLTPPQKINRIIDCAGHQSAEITAKTKVDRDGFPTNVTWAPLGAHSRLLQLVCPTASASPSASPSGASTQPPAAAPAAKSEGGQTPATPPQGQRP